MAATGVIAGSLVGTYDPNVTDGGGSSVLKAALNEDPEAINRVLGRHTFQVQANTNSDDAATVVNLNAQGVSWVGADGLRNITTKAWYRNVSGTIFGYLEKQDVVRGSAAGGTPTLSANDPAIALQDRSYRARTGLLTTTQTTPVYAQAGVAISSALAVVRVTGGVAGQDLRWLVEVTVEPMKIVPVAVT